MGHPDAVKGRVGQAESGKKEFLPAGGRAARDGRFLPTTRVDVNRNGPIINSAGRSSPGPYGTGAPLDNAAAFRPTPSLPNSLYRIINSQPSKTSTGNAQDAQARAA